MASIALRSLIRNLDLWSSLLAFGIADVSIALRSLIRNLDLWSSLLAFGIADASIALRSLIRNLFPANDIDTGRQALESTLRLYARA